VDALTENISNGLWFCDQHMETVSHLFLSCGFVRQVWFSILARLQLDNLVPDREHDLGVWWIEQRKRIDKVSQPIFDSLLLLISWLLWKERNAMVFGRSSSLAHDVVNAVIKVGVEWAAVGFTPLAALLALSSQNLVLLESFVWKPSSLKSLLWVLKLPAFTCSRAWVVYRDGNGYIPDG
jgi:hypothetical protein